MADVLALTAQPDLAARVRSMERDGYAYFPGVMSAAEVAELRAVFDRLTPIEESFDRYTTPETGGFLNKHVNNAFHLDPLFLRCTDLPDIIDLAEAVLGDDCHLIAMTAWLTGPGRPDQELHCDWLPVALPEDVLADPRVKMPVFITTAHLYLNDISEELGPTKIVPGSHKSGRRPDGETTWQGVGEQSIMCKAGDVVVFRSEVWHRGSANTSNETRYLLQVNYAQRWISQRFPPYLNVFQFDPEILSRATPRQLRLMGDHVSSNYA